MSIGAQTALALGRALLVALFAVAVAAALRGWLTNQRGPRRTLAWALLLAPFFTPPLLVSYALAKFAMALLVSPWGHETLYLGVLGLKLVPVAVVVRVLLPPPLSAEARHAFQILAHPSRRQRARFYLRATGRAPWIAAGLVFLLAFADFELASLWSVKTWTVALFDAQIGGLALLETLKLAIWPLFVEITILTAIAFATGPGRDASPPASSGERPRRGILAAALPWIYLAASTAFVAAVPFAIIAAQAIAGVPVLLENFVLTRELCVSVLFALSAGAAAFAIAGIGRKSSRLALLFAAPGLLGALTVALLVLALFQTPFLRSVYDTPIPLAVALIILLLPLALLLGALWLRPTPALHIARQLRSRRLLWELETRPRAFAFGLLFCWAYFDFTASSMLAPTGFTPVFARLYNLAHYGRTAVLSAMMIAAFATPILVLLLTGAALRLYPRGHGR